MGITHLKSILFKQKVMAFVLGSFLFFFFKSEVKGKKQNKTKKPTKGECKKRENGQKSAYISKVEKVISGVGGSVPAETGSIPWKSPVVLRLPHPGKLGS